MYDQPPKHRYWSRDFSLRIAPQRKKYSYFDNPCLTAAVAAITTQVLPLMFSLFLLHQRKSPRTRTNTHSPSVVTHITTRPCWSIKRKKRTPLRSKRLDTRDWYPLRSYQATRLLTFSYMGWHCTVSMILVLDYYMLYPC